MLRCCGGKQWLRDRAALDKEEEEVVGMSLNGTIRRGKCLNETGGCEM